MVHPLRAIRRLLSDDAATDGTTDQPATATDGGPPQAGEYVHECPGCGEVYLSETPRRCSSCGETTAAVAPSDD